MSHVKIGVWVPEEIATVLDQIAAERVPGRASGKAALVRSLIYTALDIPEPPDPHTQARPHSDTCQCPFCDKKRKAQAKTA